LETDQFSREVTFDIIYYIYPPKGTGLKSVRKSNWLSPIVDGEDCLKLKGNKYIEKTSFEKVWNLMMPEPKPNHNSPVSREQTNINMDEETKQFAN
jgi:hypothetical protein